MEMQRVDFTVLQGKLSCSVVIDKSIESRKIEIKSRVVGNKKLENAKVGQLGWFVRDRRALGSEQKLNIKTVQLAVFHTCLVFGSKVMTCKIIVEAE